MKNSLGYLLGIFLFVLSSSVFLFAQGPEFPPPATRTVVADVLDVEGEFIIVRGELGEIRIEVRDDTKITETFKFGDRIKAVIRPNDTAISVDRAGKDEPTGIVADAPASSPGAKKSIASPSSSQTTENESPAQATAPPPVNAGPKTRIIVADLLMVDGDFYVVRGDIGEIRIEATPDTNVTEKFDFGDRIKAKVLPNDKAIFIERAKPTDMMGIHTLEPPAQLQQPAPQQTVKEKPKAKTADTKMAAPKPGKKIRTIIADVLMIDGDFIIVRGERGEIQIEVTPETKLSEEFQFGDKIKAEVLPNDRALSVQRAKPEEPIGITEN